MRPYARSTRWVTKPSDRYNATAAALSPSTYSMPTVMPRSASDAKPARWSARDRARGPGGRDRRRSRRSPRARRVPSGDPARAPSSSRNPPGRRRRTRGGTRRGSNQSARSRWSSVSRVQPPCSGWFANARLFTASHSSSSCPATKVRTVDAIGPVGPFGQGEWHPQFEELAFEREAGCRAAGRRRGRRGARV